MEPPTIESPKMPDMVVLRSMCGDHQSLTKTELNAKEDREDRCQEKAKQLKDRNNANYDKVTPSTSRTERGAAEHISRVMSEHALRALEARRRVRSMELVARQEDLAAPGNRALLQAALGSFRWPPYLVAIWVLVLLMTHVLHCLVTMMERALPALKKFCTYFRLWTEELWKLDTDINSRIYPVGLALITGLLYVSYVSLYAVYAVALWSIEPLCTEDDKREDVETKVTNYVEEVNSKTNSCITK